jgi:hypothetical protein
VTLTRRELREGQNRAAYGRCPECDAPLPNPWTQRCRHRRACEARQMMQAGVPVEEAARHAQRLSRATGDKP